MYDWPIGLSTGCFYRQSIFDCLEVIRSAGFLTVEICSHPDHLDYHDISAVRRAGAQIKRLGLEPFSFHAPFAQEIDISALDERRREAAAGEILMAAEAAALLQVRYFVIHPGPEIARYPKPAERFQCMENALTVIRRVAAHCRLQGMELLLENMLPHLFLGHTRDILWILGAMPETPVGVCLDTGHAALAGRLFSDVRALAGHLRLVHAHDNAGRADDHFLPGRGTIQWEHLMATLGAVGFKGSLILELSGEQEAEAEALLSEARAARAYLRGIGRLLERARRIGMQPESEEGPAGVTDKDR